MRLQKFVVWLAHLLLVLAGFAVARAYLIEMPYKSMYYRYALYAFISVVFLMEVRVLLGGRGKRDGIFYIHLMSGVSTIVLLGILGFAYSSVLLEIEVLFFSTVIITTGLFLLHREKK